MPLSSVSALDTTTHRYSPSWHRDGSHWQRLLRSTPRPAAAIKPTDIDAVAGHITTTLVHDQLFPDLRNEPFWDGPRWLNNPSIIGRG